MLGGWLVSGCAGGPEVGGESQETPLRATRGYVLISLDALRADHLGCYGYERDTTPFLDRLAARSTRFRWSAVQYPSTVLSHMSMFTGLYPDQHAVFPPTGVLSPEIPSLAERFRAAGFKTSGHTEAGYMTRKFGFDRGFDDYSETFFGAERGMPQTFARGVRFLEGLGEDEPFFLFLHTYSIHDPYNPEEPYRSMFLPEGAPVPVLPATGESFRDVNLGRATVGPEDVDYFAALYDGLIRFADGVVESFFTDLERLGLADDTTVVITSDHGEEFFEHGRLAHTQVYPHTLFVPLIVSHPDQAEGATVEHLVQTVDIAPTLIELARLERPVVVAGRSLVPYLEDAGSEALVDEAYGESLFEGVAQWTLVEKRGGQVLQLVLSGPAREPKGVWVSESLTFESWSSELSFRALSFLEERVITVTVDGEELGTFELGEDWSSHRLPLGTGECGPCRVTLTADRECRRPVDAGVNQDTRCLGFRIDGGRIGEVELFDLGIDPQATANLARARPDDVRRLLARMAEYRWEPVATPGSSPLTEEERRALEALGYL